MKTQAEQIEFATKLKTLVEELGTLQDAMNKEVSNINALVILKKIKDNIQQQDALREAFMQDA